MAEGTKRLRVAPKNAKPVVELSIHHHKLPLPMLYAIEQAGFFGPSGLVRTSPDEYEVRMPGEGEDDDGPVSIVLPSPGVRGIWKRSIGIRWKPSHRPSVTVDVDPDDLALALLVAGYEIRPRAVPERQQLWESADGLGDPHYVARWAKEK